MVDAKSLQFIINLLDTSKNKPQGNVLLFGVWGCARVPMLREFELNLDPESGRVLGALASAFCLFVLTLISPNVAALLVQIIEVVGSWWTISSLLSSIPWCKF